MKWTKEKPTKQGWYVMKCGGSPKIVYITTQTGRRKGDGNSWWVFIGNERYSLLGAQWFDACLWFGPIPDPPESQP